MKPKAKIIELNGRRYDAMTGKLLGGAAKSAAMDVVASNIHIRKSGITSARTEPKKPEAHRPAPHHVTAHPQQHTKTLMRKFVKRPERSLKRQTKVAPHLGALVKNPQVAVIPKQAVGSVNERRQQHAQDVHPSKLIRHFNMDVSMRPIRRVPQSRSLNTPQIHATAYAVPARPIAAKKTPDAQKSSLDIFEHALEMATSHRQSAYKKPTNKKTHRLRTILGMTGFGVIAVLIVGFFAYQNATAIQLRLASTRTGVHATLPSWQPDGFSLASLTSNAGAVTMRFYDTQSSQSYSVIQSSTHWDANALLSEYVLPNTNASYQTIQSTGNTIYTYGNNAATWVTHGIWYKLTTNGSLSTSQIVQLVASM